MKKSDITRELGFIDPEFIAEAASYKPHKISKIRIVALAACIAVLVTAIPLTLILNRENGNTEDRGKQQRIGQHPTGLLLNRSSQSKGRNRQEQAK